MKKLLNKYYEGLTSEEEEQRLSNWLLSCKASEEFAADKKLFFLLNGEKETEMELPEGFSERLEWVIDRQATMAASCKVTSSKTRVIRRIMIWSGSIAVAACVAYFAVFRSGGEEVKVKSYIIEVKDPQLAKEYTEIAFKKFCYAIDKMYSKLDEAATSISKFSNVN